MIRLISPLFGQFWQKPLLLIICLLLSACTQIIFQPISTHLYTPTIVDVEYEDVYAETYDGVQLHGWKLKSRTQKKASLVFFHGNAENISTHFANVYWLVDHGYDVYTFDYRGYGKSEGIADLDLIMSDFDPVIARVLQLQSSSQKLVVMGHSFGASMLIYAAAKSQYRSKIKSVIAVSAFSDYQSISQEMLSRSWLTWAFQWPLSLTIDNDYRADAIINEISPLPLLLMHSRRDEVINFYHADVLYARAAEPKQLIEIDSDHNHVFNNEEARQLLLDYLRNL